MIPRRSDGMLPGPHQMRTTLMTTRRTTGRARRSTEKPAPGLAKNGTAGHKGVAGDGQRDAPAEKVTGDLISREDVVRFVTEHAARIAAPDVLELATESDELRARATAVDGARFDPFRAQVDEALECIDDYSEGRCDQIPYYTISVLAAALFYFQDPMDAIPDFLPEIGSIDDALVMAVATDLAGDGLRRYRAWKEAGEPARDPAPPRKPRRATKPSRD
jgi:uncharacterized membrane protein YkvA (DUF1232 family)